MIKNYSILVIILLFIILGCNKSDSSIIDLEGKSNNWQVNYKIAKTTEDSKYMIQTIISPLELNDVYNVEYSINSPGSISELSGTIKAEDGSSIFPAKSNLPGNSILRSSETTFLPRKGEQVVVTIKWNGTNSEEIILTIP